LARKILSTLMQFSILFRVAGIVNNLKWLFQIVAVILDHKIKKRWVKFLKQTKIVLCVFPFLQHPIPNFTNTFLVVNFGQGAKSLSIVNVIASKMVVKKTLGRDEETKNSRSILR